MKYYMKKSLNKIFIRGLIFIEQYNIIRENTIHNTHILTFETKVLFEQLLKIKITNLKDKI